MAKNGGFVDSIYMTIITLSTVGFAEVHELTSIEKIWTILLIIIGIKDKKGKFQLNPNMDVKLDKDQTIMLIGGKANMKMFQREFLNNK